VKTLHWTVEEPSTGEAPRLDQYLSQKTGRSRAFLQEQIEKGWCFAMEKPSANPLPD
jgi:hypothetical protein